MGSFYKVLSTCFDTAFPEITTTVRESAKIRVPWLTQGLIKSSRVREKLFNKKLKAKTENNVNNYKLYNITYNKIKRKVKAIYYKEKFLNTNIT